jgi:exosome complex component CSL4
MSTTTVTPGQRLGYAADYIHGAGTYERGGLLYASVVGQKFVEPGKTDDEVWTILTYKNLY